MTANKRYVLWKPVDHAQMKKFSRVSMAWLFIFPMKRADISIGKIGHDSEVLFQRALKIKGLCRACE
jgi:hypothetical protein